MRKLIFIFLLAGMACKKEQQPQIKDVNVSVSFTGGDCSVYLFFKEGTKDQITIIDPQH